MKINERILIPCRTVVEAVTDDEGKGVIVRGKLITCNMPTRNGISYTQESMARFINDFNMSRKTMPFLDSHDDTSIRKSPPFGHITKLFMQGPEVFYEADIDPEEKMFLHKLRRGDIREVSLQAIVDAVDEVSEANGNNSIIADVRELLEVSSVLIPGARDTSAEIQEKFITEERFVETFKFAQKNNITFKESLRTLEARDDNELMGGPIRKIQNEEDLTTDNGSALIGTELPKKKNLDDLKKRAEWLKIVTKRF